MIYIGSGYFKDLSLGNIKIISTLYSIRHIQNLHKDISLKKDLF